MNPHFKNIHIGQLIKHRVRELEMDMPRVCKFFKCTEDEIEHMFLQKDLPTDIMMKWCKLLGYDFFRIYSQHLILYSPPSAIDKKKDSSLPRFRKSIYTREIIDFMMEIINTKEKTKAQIIEEYGIPKTTLYKWIEKYNK